MRKLLRFLFVPAHKLRPRRWWCASCQEMHYALMQRNWKQ